MLLSWVCFDSSSARENRDLQKNLLTPTGPYSFKVQDIFLVNHHLCPDTFYKKNTNERDFSPTNKQHCHEIMLRVYYPIVKNKTKKSPMILFMSGAGLSSHFYSNIISNLVSHGYIVLAINSLFINGELPLSNGHMVAPPESYVDADGRKANISDLKFILDNLATIKFKRHLNDHIDFTNISAIGHSRGAMSIVNLLKQHPEYEKRLKTIVLMDPGDLLLEQNYPLPKYEIPSLVLWSSSFKEGMKGAALLGKNNCEVVLKPSNASNDYSKHENFTDNGTLQYNPRVQEQHALQRIDMGAGNGNEIAMAINDYILFYLDSYQDNAVTNSTLERQKFNIRYVIRCDH